VTAPGSLSRRDGLAVGAALAILVLAVYGRTAAFPFVSYDDDVFLYRNPAVSGGLSWASVRYALTAGNDAGWIPLTWLSRLLDVSLFGMDARGHHGVNVALHLASVLLCFRFLTEATGRRWESAFAAALFAVHPLHVESVAWVTERKDVLSGLFWFLSLTAYVRWTRSPSRGGYALLLLFFALSLMSKPIAVTLPFVLLLLDFWPLGRLRLPSAGSALPAADGEEPWRGGGAAEGNGLPWRRLLAEKAPLFALSAGISAAALFLQERAGAVSLDDFVPLWGRLGNAVLSYGLYLWKTVWPARLAVHYPHPETALPAGETVVSLLVLVVVTALAWRERGRRPWLLAGWLWFLGVLVPVIGLVQAGAQAMADRCVYLPSTGLYAAVAWGASEAVRRFRIGPRATAAAAALLLAALASRAYVQAGYWGDSETLFRRALALTERNWVVRTNLASLLAREGRNEEAAAEYREVLRLRPGWAKAEYALYSALTRLGRDGEAREHFEAAVRRTVLDPESIRGIALSLAGQGRAEEAEAFLRRALSVRPDFPDAHYDLAVTLGRLGRKEEALPHFREALRIPPADAESVNRIGVALVRLGRAAEAESRFREAIALDPSLPEARFNLAATLERLGKREEAASAYRELLRRAPGDGDARKALDRLEGKGGEGK
jgi:tetratricopeptide (TPR) repeat protein